MPDPLRYDTSDGVATLTLARPEAMNALDVALKESLRDRLQAVAEDASVRAVVLTGSGDKAFCVGQDLREHVENVRSKPVEEVWSTVPDHYAPIARTLAGMPKPVVAAVNGVAAGAGASLAFACDFRVLSENAGFNTAFAGIGLACDTGASWTLPRLVGWAKAAELLLMPSTVPAAEAATLGLATSVVPQDELAGAAHTLATRLASGPTVAYASIKQALAFSATHDLDASLEFEGQQMARTGATEDHRDAVDAFVAKETPLFHGR
ncbi:MAG: enoyl-CoA hydratase/isomerase family protein [Actinomycetes bacterium]